MSPQALHDLRRQLCILNHAKQSGNVSQTCRYFGVSREIFYRWEHADEQDGERAPNSAPAGKSPYEMLREKLNLNVAVAKVE